MDTDEHLAGEAECVSPMGWSASAWKTPSSRPAIRVNPCPSVVSSASFQLNRTYAVGARTLVRRRVESSGTAGILTRAFGSTVGPPFSDPGALWGDASATPGSQAVRTFRRTEVRAPIEWNRLKAGLQTAFASTLKEAPSAKTKSRGANTFMLDKNSRRHRNARTHEH